MEYRIVTNTDPYPKEAYTSPLYAMLSVEHALDQMPYGGSVTIHKQRTKEDYPAKWKKGMRVKYIKSIEWGPSKGDTGTIKSLRKEHMDREGHEYQVFYVTPDKSWGPGESSFWTTPDDVVALDG